MRASATMMREGDCDTTKIKEGCQQGVVMIEKWGVQSEIEG